MREGLKRQKRAEKAIKQAHKEEREKKRKQEIFNHSEIGRVTLSQLSWNYEDYYIDDSIDCSEKAFGLMFESHLSETLAAANVLLTRFPNGIEHLMDVKKDAQVWRAYNIVKKHTEMVGSYIYDRYLYSPPKRANEQFYVLKGMLPPYLAFCYYAHDVDFSLFSHVFNDNDYLLVYDLCYYHFTPEHRAEYDSKFPVIEWQEQYNAHILANPSHGYRASSNEERDEKRDMITSPTNKLSWELLHPEGGLIDWNLAITGHPYVPGEFEKQKAEAQKIKDAFDQIMTFER